MTKLLEQAIAEVLRLPDEAQDAAAEALFAHVAHHDRPYRLTDEQVEEINRRQQALRQGKTQLATDEEVAAMWKRCGA